jgi:hypothetical protein
MSQYFIPGDVQLKKVELVNFNGDVFDIRGLFVYVELFEDILASSLSANVLMQDAIGLFENFPIIGKEKLNLIYTTSSDLQDVVIELVAHKVPQRNKIKDNFESYELNFVSKEFLTNQTSVVRRSLKGNIGDTIESIIKVELDSEKEMNAIVSPANPTTFIPTRQHPIDVINLLLTKAKSPESVDHTDFMFYETVDGFNLATINHLVAQPVSFSYKYGKPNNPSNESPDQDEFFIIGNFRVDQESAPADSIMNGGYGGTLGVYDPITRTYKEKQYDYQSDKSKFNYLSDQLLTHNDDEHQKKAKSGFFRYVLKGTKDETFLTRNAKIDQIFNGIRIIADVPGNSELRIGQVIAINLPSSTLGDDSKQQMDQDSALSGKYLISSIKHVFAQGHGSYRSVIELVKDSIDKPITPKLDKLPSL